MQRKVSIAKTKWPIGIARFGGTAGTTTRVVAVAHAEGDISLHLGIFNLFPIPILDGGMILMLLIEG